MAFLGFLEQKAMEHVLPRLRQRGITVLFIAANARIKVALHEPCLRTAMGEENDCDNFADAMAYCVKHLSPL
ncbi:hypothetical protein D9M69_728600 [compost metagenome]